MSDNTITKLYDMIQMCLEIWEPCCLKHKRTPLQLVWITDEAGDELLTWYIECPKKNCNLQYMVNIEFTPIDIPEGKCELKENPDS